MTIYREGDDASLFLESFSFWSLFLSIANYMPAGNNGSAEGTGDRVDRGGGGGGGACGVAAGTACLSLPMYAFRNFGVNFLCKLEGVADV